jgi:hypothetical protein
LSLGYKEDRVKEGEGREGEEGREEEEEGGGRREEGGTYLRVDLCLNVGSLVNFPITFVIIVPDKSFCLWGMCLAVCLGRGFILEEDIRLRWLLAEVVSGEEGKSERRVREEGGMRGEGMGGGVRDE